MPKSVFEIIKKQNGERFAKVLRDNNLLSIPDLPGIVKYAGTTEEDAEIIKMYLWSLREFHDKETRIPEDPFELLHRAGYTAEYADTLSKQNAIKKYFVKDDMLCTFNDPERYIENYIINAVRFDADTVKRSDNPMRQDAYGTSVISIQIAKDGSKISIKNRYNHSVKDGNPDDTFDSNPDNIIEGLSVALKAYFDVDWKPQYISFPRGYTTVDGRVIKYNMEVNNMYFGPDYYEGHGKIIPLDKNSQIMMDCFVWDNKEKKLLDPANSQDPFVEIFNKVVAGKKIKITGHAPDYTLLADGQMVVRISNGEITAVSLPTVKEIPNAFLAKNRKISDLNLPDAEIIGDDFIMFNTELKKLVLPRAKKIGDTCMTENTCLQELKAPHLESVGEMFLVRNNSLQKLNLPKLKTSKKNFLPHAPIKTVHMPKFEKAEGWFLTNDSVLEELVLPKVTEMGDDCLTHASSLRKVILPELRIMGDRFLAYNKNVEIIEAPKLEIVGSSFMEDNQKLQHLLFPNLRITGGNFFRFSLVLLDMYAPSLEQVGSGFCMKSRIYFVPSHKDASGLLKRAEPKISLQVEKNKDKFKQARQQFKELIQRQGQASQQNNTVYSEDFFR